MRSLCILFTSMAITQLVITSVRHHDVISGVVGLVGMVGFMGTIFYREHQ